MFLAKYQTHAYIDSVFQMQSDWLTMRNKEKEKL